MATQTPLHHPKASAQNEQFFRFTVNFGSRKTGSWVATEGLQSLKAQYEPAEGSGGGMFQAESPDTDRLLILGYYSAIKKGMRLSLQWPEGGQRREFAVKDAVPGDSGPTVTLLTIGPPDTGNN